jgi:hypothetical protein
MIKNTIVWENRKYSCDNYTGFCNDFFGKRGNMRNNNGKTFEAVLGTIEW